MAVGGLASPTRSQNKTPSLSFGKSPSGSLRLVNLSANGMPSPHVCCRCVITNDIILMGLCPMASSGSLATAGKLSIRLSGKVEKERPRPFACLTIYMSHSLHFRIPPNCLLQRERRAELIAAILLGQHTRNSRRFSCIAHTRSDDAGPPG